MSAFIKYHTHDTLTPASARPRKLDRDILWGQPVFKAPELPNPNPRALFDQLPFTAARITHQPVENKAAS